MTIARRSAAVIIAVAALCGCGGGDPAAPASPVPQLDPPQAAEPVGGPVAEEAPGRIVAVGDTPEGVAIDPASGLAAVAVDEPPRLVLVDVASGAVRDQVRLPGSARHVEFGGGRFLVPVEDADQLVQITPDGETTTTDVGDGAHDATAVGDRVFTADEFGSTMSVVRDGRLVGQVPVDAQPGGITAVGDRVAVIAVRAYTVELYDGSEDVPRGQGAQSAGLGPSHVVPAGDGLAIADTRGHALVVYDAVDRLRYARRIPLDGTPVGLAPADDGNVWVALSERNQAVEIDPRSGRVVDTVDTVQSPFSLAYADGTLAIASQATGTLQLVQP